MAFIRAYQRSDKQDIIHIFRETADQGLQEAGDPALHYASYNWARPYIMLLPEHVTVIDDGTGRAVGYFLGVPDTKSFVDNYKTHYLPYLESQGLRKPPDGDNDENNPDKALAMQYFAWRPEAMLHQKTPSLLEQYPAHMHIDILSDFQGQGWGRRLIEQALQKFRDFGVRGIHLGKVGSNFRAGKFYDKLGFGRFHEVMDDGKSGEVGRMSDGGIYLVKAL